ncbi:hypothetical protein [Tolypothrix sp. FACHB-123]|nr:hypothetical protein [Tolypothrix sp. FACHB-123]
MLPAIFQIISAIALYYPLTSTAIALFDDFSGKPPYSQACKN